MKDAYYFPHDSNATDDPKIAALISKYGFQGYGWFWRVIELLRNQPGYKYPLNKYTFDTFARVFQYERNTVVDFINDCCHEFADEHSALLCMDDKNLWSESLIKRMKPLDDKRQKARESVQKRWDKYDSNTIVQQSNNDGNTSKVNKSKVNNNNKSDLIDLFSENDLLKKTIREFVKMRVKIKKPMTDRAIELMLNKLNKLSSDETMQIAILNESIEKSWSDIYALKAQDNRSDPYRRAE